jgi:SpoVK/Ycf46/Vps4 family AAA+-type ATPase
MNSHQVVALIEAHVAGDRKRFADIALQIGHHEKRLGHAIGERILTKIQSQLSLTPLPVGGHNRDELFDIIAPEFAIADLVLDRSVEYALSQILDEFRHAEVLAQHELRPINRVLFDGPPGTGKTASAHALARALGIPLLIARHDTIISSYLGETASSLRKAFDYIAQNRVVALFDEFDSFGRARSSSEKNDVGEMHRILNVLLQLIERHKGPSLVICATNLPDVLDAALERRFDLTVTFPMPSEQDCLRLLKLHLNERITHPEKSIGQSHAQIVRQCIRTKKLRILGSMR